MIQLKQLLLNEIRITSGNKVTLHHGKFGDNVWLLRFGENNSAYTAFGFNKDTNVYYACLSIYSILYRDTINYLNLKHIPFKLIKLDTNDDRIEIKILKSNVIVVKDLNEVKITSNVLISSKDLRSYEAIAKEYLEIEGDDSPLILQNQFISVIKLNNIYSCLTPAYSQPLYLIPNIYLEFREANNWFVADDEEEHKIKMKKYIETEYRNKNFEILKKI